MAIAVDWDVKNQTKQTNKQTNKQKGFPIILIFFI